MNRIYVFHFPLGFLIGCFILVHILVPHPFFSSIPTLSNSCSSLMVPSYLSSWKDFPVGIPVISNFLGFFLFWLPDLLGNCDNPIYANPPMTPNHILPE